LTAQKNETRKRERSKARKKSFAERRLIILLFLVHIDILFCDAIYGNDKNA